MPMLTTARIALAGVPGPLARREAVGEVAHPVEHLVHVGHHVLAVDLQAGASGHAQGHVEHGPVLGGVDVLAGEHRVDAPTQVDSLHQGDEQPPATDRTNVSGLVVETHCHAADRARVPALEP